MKKNILSALVICAALFGCQKNEIHETRPSGVELHATIEDDASTRTVMDENNNICWSEGDQIIAFMKSSYGHKYKLISSFVGKTYADFEPATSAGGNLSAGTEWNHNVVYYPYSADVEAIKSGDNYTLSVVLPSEQTYAAESFGNGFFPMVAVSENNNITFKNVLGGIKLQLRGTQKVKSIKFEGKNNEELSGAASVTAYTDETKPAITMASGASTSLALNCGSGVQLNESKATEFIIALPPVRFSKGFTMTVVDDAGNEQTIQTDKENSVLRSSLLVMPEVTLDKVPQTVDYVDEYGINHGQGVKIGDTVWAPVNCGYHATDYKYGKLYQWGRKYGQGYSGDLYNINGICLGEVSDATVPTIEEGGISVAIGNHNSNSNIFYTGTPAYAYYYDWVDSKNDKLWNSGTEDSPVRTEYDPCPEGWRVPTYAELNELCQNHSSWTTGENRQTGYWFSATEFYSKNVPQVFLPSSGQRYDDGRAYGRGNGGIYWSSKPGNIGSENLVFNSSNVYMYHSERSIANSVRCVQE